MKTDEVRYMGYPIRMYAHILKIIMKVRNLKSRAHIESKSKGVGKGILHDFIPAYSFCMNFFLKKYDKNVHLRSLI